MQIYHLPILWLPHAGMGLRVRRVKFRRVGHRFNRESCVGTTVSCSKRLCHLVNCCAGSKGVLWLNRSWNKRALEECGRRRTHGTLQHMLLDISETAKVPSAVAQSQNSVRPHIFSWNNITRGCRDALFKSVGFSPLSWSAYVARTWPFYLCWQWSR